MILLGIITVDFVVTDQVLIKYFCIRQILDKNWSTVSTYDSVRMELLHSILVESGVPMKLVRLIKICLNEACRKVHICKYLSYTFPIQNCLRKRDSLSPLLFNSTVEQSIRRSRKRSRLEKNWTHHLLVYVDDINLLGDNIDIIKKNEKELIDASKEVDVEVNTEKTKYMLLFHHQIAGHSHNIKTANRSFENMTKLEYLGIIVTNQSFIHYVFSLFFHLLLKNVKIKL
jgi:hypothetical protein